MSESLFEQMPKAEAAVLHSLQALCSRSEQCRSALQKKIIAMGMDSEACERILQDLEQEAYFSDLRYAQCFVRDKSRLQLWGTNKIRYALKAKQIAQDVIETALKEIQEDALEEPLKKLFAQKAKTLKAKNSTELQAKLYRFGLSRGFGYDQIRRILLTLDKE